MGQQQNRSILKTNIALVAALIGLLSPSISAVPDQNAPALRNANQYNCAITQYYKDASSDKQAIHCMACNLYHEARGETKKGQDFVAYVVLNRMKREKKSACEVVWQDRQFSWTADDLSDDVPTPNEKVMDQLLKRSAKLWQQRKSALPIAANFYHATTLPPHQYPQWSCEFGLESRVGNHVFYNSRKPGDRNNPICRARAEARAGIVAGNM